MKISILTAALIALSASVSFADHDDHDDHHESHHDGRHGPHESLAHRTQTRESLLTRLEIAPTHYGHHSNIHSIEEAALSAHTVKMLGKVEYDYGKSWLGHRSKHAIEEVILRSPIEHGANALIVVLGYADRTGRASVNFRLSDSRATNVKKHIDHINWERNLGFRTTTVPMGEEVELCKHDLGHNRVAEIWLVELPKPVGHFFSVVNPVIEHHRTAESHITHHAPTQNVVTVQQAPVHKVVTSVQHSPRVVIQKRIVSPFAQLAEFLEHNVVLAPNADPNEFARQLSLLKTLNVQ